MQSTPISNLKNSISPPIPNMSSSFSEPSLQTCQNEVTCYNLQTASDHDISYRWAPVRFVSLQQDGFDMEVNVVDPTSLETGNNVVRDEDSFDFNEDLKTALAGNTTLLHDDYVPPDTIMPPLKPRILGIQIETNEEGILLEKNNKHQKNMDGNEQEKDDQLRFPLKDVDLLIERSNPKDENIERLILELKPVMRHPDDEWYAVVQTRFYVARTGEKFRMAGAEVFSLGKRCEPLELRLEPEVDALKVEMRYVYQTFHRMPTFTEGDMQLFFPKEEKDAEVPVCVDRALLSLFCPKFERAIGNQPFNECFNPHVDVNRQQFVELLYQVYRTKRPLNANLEQLCVAVNKVAGPQLQWKLRQHFVNDTEKSSMEKAKRAAQLGLDDTVIHLCYDAVKTREWKPLQKEDDFDAPSFFGPEVYGRLVLPAAIQAIKDLNSADPNIRALLFEQKFPIAKPDFVSPFESGNPNSVQLQADQHIFNVNIGVLRVHACMDKFAVGCDNTYRPIVSSALKAELQRCQIQLAQAVLPVLEMLYGVTNRVPNHLVRACLIFAHDHGMRSVVEDLEELLIDEPNDHSGMMLNHLMMAEQYELANLKRHSLWQLELIQCQPIALAMIQLPEYGKLSQQMRLDVEDRICSGWAKFESKLASREPTNLKAYLFGLLGKDKAKVEPATMDNNAMELATVELVGDPPFDHFSNYQALLAEQDDLRTAQHPEDIVNQQQK